MAPLSDDTALPGQLSDQLRGFLSMWQPQQRRTAGLQAALFVRLDAVRRHHPEWQHYDLLTHALAALHVVIENDRLIGGRPRAALVADVASLCAWEHPDDDAARHREIAEALLDVLVNERERQTRFTDRYTVAGPDGRPQHPVQSFSLVTAAGSDESVEPVLRATPEAINVFQNLFEFNPFDRLAAERYRSERMLARRDYDEVLDSVERRAMSVHGLSSQLDVLLRRIAYNVRDVDYTADAIPQLDEILVLVAVQVDVEERFAASVAEHLHLQAPNAAHLQNISDHLDQLVIALIQLQRKGRAVRVSFEEEQDRQLFTHRQLTISPQAQLLGPLLDLGADVVADLLEPLLAKMLGPRRPRILNIQRLTALTAPPAPAPSPFTGRDPFELGNVRTGAQDFDSAVAGAVDDVLAAVIAPTPLSQLIADAGEHAVRVGLSPQSAALLPWALAVTVAGAYAQAPNGPPDAPAQRESTDASYVVVRTGAALRTQDVGGDDLMVVPLHRPRPADPPEDAARTI